MPIPINNQNQIIHGSTCTVAPPTITIETFVQSCNL